MQSGGHLMFSICAASNFNHHHPKPQVFRGRWGRERDSVESQWEGGMRYICAVSEIISGREGGIAEPAILEDRWATTCVRIMKVTMSSPVNNVLMARAVITPQLHTPSEFVLFNFSFTLWRIFKCWPTITNFWTPLQFLCVGKSSLSVPLRN